MRGRPPIMPNLELVAKVRRLVPDGKATRFLVRLAAITLDVRLALALIDTLRTAATVFKDPLIGLARNGDLPILPVTVLTVGTCKLVPRDSIRPNFGAIVLHLKAAVPSNPAFTGRSALLTSSTVIELLVLKGIVRRGVFNDNLYKLPSAKVTNPPPIIPILGKLLVSLVLTDAVIPPVIRPAGPTVEVSKLHIGIGYRQLEYIFTISLNPVEAVLTVVTVLRKATDPNNVLLYITAVFVESIRLDLAEGPTVSLEVVLSFNANAGLKVCSCQMFPDVAKAVVPSTCRVDPLAYRVSGMLSSALWGTASNKLKKLAVMLLPRISESLTGVNGSFGLNLVSDA